ncbi:MAG TPA: type II secretion system ATPase GspE [Polyangiaceae bacterium]|nr:type II secretion system ATPase GspE [Polyangiaceae bacterium]
MREDRFLGEVLVRHGLLSPERLEQLFELQREKGSDLIGLLVSGNIVDEVSLHRALADEAGLPFVEKIDVEAIPTALATQLPITYAKAHRIIPIDETDSQITILCADPFSTATIDDVRALLSKRVDLKVATAEGIVDAINRVYEREVGHASDLKTESGEDADDDEIVDILDSDDDAPIIRWVRSLYRQAVKERASDIHIEPEEREVIVRYRIDGKLYVAKKAPRQFMNSIISRVKIEAGLNIAEKRLPQDGRISFKIAGKSIDVRVSTIPTSRGFERIVMRLLHKTAVLLDLTDLGFSSRDYALMDGLITKPNGIILVTGPTGSGKTTTLYACLNRINKPNINILTAEDPVEYEIGGIHQVPVQAKIGLTFAAALRSFLRQDPDVIMVGEIRDRETAEIAIHASLTGHLVLSTIHTNDAASAVTRLVEMGIEPFLVRSSVIGILAQRLVRVLCPDCREAYHPSAYELSQLGIDPERSKARRARNISARYLPHGCDYVPVGTVEGQVPTVYRPRGCPACMDTGYTGRKGIYELLMVNEFMAPLILRNADAQSIKQVAMERGMDSLRDDGARKVLEGVTSVAEVLAATQEDVAVAE